MEYEEKTLERSPDTCTCGEEASIFRETRKEDVKHVDLNLHLVQTAEKAGVIQTRDTEISLPYPRTGKQLKELIESNLQIPVCVQKLFFHSQPVLDNQCLLSLYLRDGDVITVEYTTQADLKEIVKIIQIMDDAVNFIENHKYELQNSSNETMNVDDTIRPQQVEHLRDYFDPYISEKVTANRLCFVHNNGIQVAVKLHRLLSSLSWDQMPVEMQKMECSVLKILWHLSSKFGIRCLIFKQPELFDQLCATILREKVNSFGPVHQNMNYLLMKTMLQGMGIIVNLSEIPSCLMEIAGQTEIIEQMKAAMLSPYFPIQCSHAVVITFLNLSYNPQTHRYLVSPSILLGLVELCNRYTTPYFAFQDFPEEFAVRYFAILFFTAICALSTDFATSQGFNVYSKNILVIIKKFLQHSSIGQAREAEEEVVYSWATMKPFVSLVYSCNEAQMNSKLVEEKPLLKDLYLASLQMGIFLLQRACTTEDTLEILEMEGLIDFIICLPWHVSEGIKEKAKIAVQLLSKKRTLQPPSLMNIAKAKLAVWKIPFQKTMSYEFLDKVHHYVNTSNF